MQKLTHDAICQLVELEAKPKVTIYMPLEATASPPHITENQIRLKNLTHKAADELDARHDTSKLSNELREMYESLKNDLDFWKEARRGILLCAAPGVIQMYNLPVDTEEYVAVDDNFHLAPILALLSDNHEYYVMALAQQGPKVYRGDMYGLELIDIGLPANIRVALGIDEANQKSENQGSANGTSMRAGWFNGRGGARDPMDADRLKYFHLLDGILMDKLDRDLSLILAGIEAEAVEFKHLSKYPHILEAIIPGNHTDTHPEELFAKAWPIIDTALIQPEHQAAKEEYERLSGANPDRVASDKEAIETAAEQGRIDKLLATMSSLTTDTVQDKVESVFRISFPEPASSRSMNNLAMKVWQMSGKVLSLMPNEMPNGALMVARLRY